MSTQTHIFITWKNRTLKTQVTLRIAKTGQYLSKHQLDRLERSVTPAKILFPYSMPKDWITDFSGKCFWIGPQTDYLNDTMQ